MCGTFLYYTLGLILFVDIFNICSALTVEITRQISVFEYGVHVEGEEASFAVNDVIPYLTPHYKLNVTPVTPHLEKRYTYLIVEYISPMSFVNISFNPDNFILSFYIKFPFLPIPYGVVGYSLKHPGSRVWSSWRRSSRKSNGIQSKSTSFKNKNDDFFAMSAIPYF